MRQSKLVLILQDLVVVGPVDCILTGGAGCCLSLHSLIHVSLVSLLSLSQSSNQQIITLKSPTGLFLLSYSNLSQDCFFNVSSLVQDVFLVSLLLQGL